MPVNIRLRYTFCMDIRDVAALVKRYYEKSGMTQTSVAAALSTILGRHVGQNQVSEHLRGMRWEKNLALAGAYVRVLGIPPDEMAKAMGYPIPNAPRAATLADVIKAAPPLSPAAKRHLLNQYGLLQLATQQERSGKPVLRDSQSSRKSRRTAAD